MKWPYTLRFPPGRNEVALHPPLSAGPADPAGAAQEEHLLLLRIASASRVLDYCWTYIRLVLYLYTFGAPTRRLPPTLPSLAGWLGGLRGKRDQRCCFYHPIWQPLGRRLSWKDCCCCWLWLDLLAISRTLCSEAVSGVMLQNVHDFAGKKEKQVWKEVALHPPLCKFRKACRPGGSCTGGAPTAAADRVRFRDYCWTYIHLVLYLYTFGYPCH